MLWDKFTKMLQFAGAALAVPAAAGGTYSVYRTYFAPEVACQNLRGTIIATMDKNVPADVKHVLMQKDVADFDKNCAIIDPDAQMIFQATMHQLAPKPSPPAAGAQSAPENGQAGQSSRPAGPVAAAAATRVAQSTAGPFGLSTSGERRGWVVLVRRDAGQGGDVNFDGFAFAGTAMPPAGTKLTARRMMPVWLEPLPPGPNDPTRVQGRLAAGSCVQVLATQPALVRQWGEVTPCS